MITKEALKRTIVQLRKSKYAPQYAGICKALNMLLANQCAIDRYEELRLKEAEKVLNTERY